jgi:hypothetical protein
MQTYYEEREPGFSASIEVKPIAACTVAMIAAHDPDGRESGGKPDQGKRGKELWKNNLQGIVKKRDTWILITAYSVSK